MSHGSKPRIVQNCIMTIHPNVSFSFLLHQSMYQVFGDRTTLPWYQVTISVKVDKAPQDSW